MKHFRYILCGLLLVLLYSCQPEFYSPDYQRKLGVQLADSMATRETVNLFYNLQQHSKTATIFGHHHSTKYGIGWKGDYLRSDVKDVTGEFPGLYGWDFLELFHEIKTGNPDNTKELVTDAYNRGGINTFAWHYNNPVSGRSFYDTTRAVEHIIPGGSHHGLYKIKLQSIAHYVNNLRGAKGELIPVIFRPYHEFDGSWFWWGKEHCSAQDYKSLWRFTVDYMRDSLQVCNLIYAFSIDRNFENADELLERYPGDEYVDLIGLDDYWDFTPEGEGAEAVFRKLAIIDSVAKSRKKLCAFTETGLETVPDSTWWTKQLAPIVTSDSLNIAYVMVWRNDRLSHFYAPYKGHNSCNDFIEFMNDPKICFEHELPSLYHTVTITARSDKDKQN